jgi:hypothetical protein
MEASIAIEGGVAHFPGLARERRVDLASLSDAEKEQLKQLAKSVGSTRARTGAPQKPVPDARTYRIVLDLGDGKKELTVSDPVGDPALSELIGFLQQHAR